MFYSFHLSFLYYISLNHGLFLFILWFILWLQSVRAWFKTTRNIRVCLWSHQLYCSRASHWPQIIFKFYWIEWCKQLTKIIWTQPSTLTRCLSCIHSHYFYLIAWTQGNSDLEITLFAAGFRAERATLTYPHGLVHLKMFLFPITKCQSYFLTFKWSWKLLVINYDFVTER